MDSTLAVGQWMPVADWLLGRKVESVEHMDSTVELGQWITSNYVR